jgi:rhodanese-related sulfurtransferase
MPCVPSALLPAALLILSMATGCAAHVERRALLAEIEAGRAPAIVDVRTRGEYETSHVPGAVHIPFHAILARQASLPESDTPDEPLVLYCEHGPRAGLARAQLLFVSRRRVRFLRGHMTAWKKDALPVVTGASPGSLDGEPPGPG